MSKRAQEFFALGVDMFNSYLFEDGFLNYDIQLSLFQLHSDILEVNTFKNMLCYKNQFILVSRYYNGILKSSK